MPSETYSPSQPDFEAKDPEQVKEELQNDTRYPDDERAHVRALAEDTAYNSAHGEIARREEALKAAQIKEQEYQDSPTDGNSDEKLHSALRREVIEEEPETIARLKQNLTNLPKKMNHAGDRAEMQYYDDQEKNKAAE